MTKDKMYRTWLRFRLWTGLDPTARTAQRRYDDLQESLERARISAKARQFHETNEIRGAEEHGARRHGDKVVLHSVDLPEPVEFTPVPECFRTEAITEDDFLDLPESAGIEVQEIGMAEFKEHADRVGLERQHTFEAAPRTDTDVYDEGYLYFSQMRKL